MIECLVVVSFVCLTQARALEITPGGLTRSATAQVEGAELFVWLYSDNLLTLDPSRMDRACSGDACVIYHKTCEAEARRIRCEYSLAGRPFIPSLILSARDREAFARAASRVFLLAEPGGTDRLVPLSALSEVSNERAPTCRDGPRGHPCPPGVGGD